MKKHTQNTSALLVLFLSKPFQLLHYFFNSIFFGCINYFNKNLELGFAYLLIYWFCSCSLGCFKKHKGVIFMGFQDYCFLILYHIFHCIENFLYSVGSRELIGFIHVDYVKIVYIMSISNGNWECLY